MTSKVFAKMIIAEEALYVNRDVKLSLNIQMASRDLSFEKCVTLTTAGEVVEAAG